jgi:hypothetical protein
MLSVALRGEEDEFAATDTLTMLVPLPVPVLSVTHGTGLCAFQAQPAAVVTVTNAIELLPLTAIDVGETV